MEEVGEWEGEAVSQALEDVEGEVTFPVLDVAHITAVDAGVDSELLLGDFPRFAQFDDSQSDTFLKSHRFHIL